MLDPLGTNPWYWNEQPLREGEPAVAVYEPGSDTLGLYPAGGANMLELHPEKSTSQRAVYRDVANALLVGAVCFKSGLELLRAPTEDDRDYIRRLGAAPACVQLWDTLDEQEPVLAVATFEAFWGASNRRQAASLGDLIARARAGRDLQPGDPSGGPEA